MDACYDGRCEVVVAPSTTVPLDRRLRVQSLTVHAVGRDDVTILVAVRGGASIGCTGDNRCSTSVTGGSAQSPAMGRFTAHPGARVTANRLTIDVVAVVRGRAVLRLTPR